MSIILYIFIIIFTFFIGLIIFGIFHKLKRKEIKYKVGPPTKIGILFKFVNFFGDHIYYPLLNKRLVVFHPNDIKNIRLPLNIEEAVMGPSVKNFMKGAEALHNSLNNKNCFFTTTGQFALKQIILTHTQIGREITQYLYDHQQKVKKGLVKPYKPIQSPLIISGLPRTGSTLLFSLLSQDPNSRVLRNWEMFKPIPPPTKETIQTDSRIEDVKKLQNLVRFIQPNFTEELWKVHYYEAHCVEEELLIMMPNLMLITHSIFLGRNCEFTEWYLQQEGKEFIYTFLYKFLQLMATNYPPISHWVLKTPVHSVYPEILMKTFPDARVIVTHRDPINVIPSWTKLCTRVLAHYFDEKDSRYCFDSEAICRNTLEQMSLAANRLCNYRKQNPDKKDQYFDIYYNEFTKDPIENIKQLYKNYNLEYTIEFENNMKKWLIDNPIGKYGRVTYNLKEFNLTEDDVYKEFKDYLSIHPRCKTKLQQEI